MGDTSIETLMMIWCDCLGFGFGAGYWTRSVKSAVRRRNERRIRDRRKGYARAHTIQE